MNIGERVSGRYKVIGKVGAGGMANVYLAEDLILEREVAVKMMALDFQDDDSNYRRFQREALSTTELTHPNIVNIYDVGEGERPYIVMEYVDGMDLKQHIQENHPIPYKRVIDIMNQLLSGVAYAHANGVIHRDIKPHNILIDGDRNVKITDFGIAVALSQNSITQTNSLLGSVQYISPEQARGNMVTKQSDIYSLGIVLYEMLTGSVPFEGESAVSIALKHFQTPIPSLHDFDSRIPQPLENVVLKATAKEPRDRYASVDEMKEDLATALDPNRRDEVIFVPKDPNDEDTLVLDATVAEVNNTLDTQPIQPIPVKEEPKEPAEEPKQKRKRWWLLLIPVLLLAVGLFVLLQRPGQVDIPEELVGLTYDDAVALLEEHALLPGDTIEEANNEVEEGIVFRVNPDLGATVREGSEVDLYVSLGEEPFEMGNYEGNDYEEVRAELTELGFTVESEESSHETVAAGNIIEQDIDPGEDVLISETTITFTVSTGRPTITMIDLVGYSRASVDDYINQNNLRLESTEETSDEVPFGQVISQDPEEDDTLYAGETVSVVFSSGPEEVSTIPFSRQIIIPYTERFADPDSEENPVEGEEENGEAVEPELLPNEIQIYIDDLEKNMNTATHEFSITEDTPYRLDFVVEEGESASYRVVRDGEEIDAVTIAP